MDDWCLVSLAKYISIFLFFLLVTSCLKLEDDVVQELSTLSSPDSTGSGPGGGPDPDPDPDPVREWVFYTKSDGLAEDTVTTMMKDSQNYYWFGHFSKGITRWDGEDEYINISSDDGLSNNYVFRIVEAPNGEVWVATARGYDIINGKDVVQSNFLNFTFTDIIFPEEGTTWLASQGGIYVFSNAGDSIIRDDGCNLCQSTLRLLIDSDQNIWASSSEDLRRYNISNNYRVDQRYFLSPREGIQFPAIVTEIFEDEIGNIYGGSLYGEFNTFVIIDSEPSFFNFSTASIAGVSAIRTYNNSLWVGTRGSGVIQTDGVTLFQFFNELPSTVVLDLLNDGPSIWIATFGGIAKYTAP